MLVNECTSSTVVDKNVGDPTVAEVPAPDKPARGMADEEDEGDKDGQGTPADHEVLPEDGDSKEGKDATADGMPMEEEPSEAGRSGRRSSVPSTWSRTSSRILTSQAKQQTRRDSASRGW